MTQEHNTLPDYQEEYPLLIVEKRFDSTYSDTHRLTRVLPNLLTVCLSLHGTHTPARYAKERAGDALVRRRISCVRNRAMYGSPVRRGLTAEK